MKRKGLSWDGGKKRIVAAAMMLSVLAAPGVAHASPVEVDADVSASSSSVELTVPIVRTQAFFGVSWG